MFRKQLWEITAITILFISQLVLATAANENNFYTAGVVEFRPVVAGMSSADMLSDHLQAYLEILHSSEAKSTDIIVFPEGTLNNALQLTYAPSAEEAVIPCLHSGPEYADFLVQLSCAARDLRKYVLINLTEKEDCPASDAHDPRPCAGSGLNVYNTNVVFDREGRVVSRYRKVHVYQEAKNTTFTPEFGIFETDFGVRFGHFVCFDMLFYTPAQELVVRHGIRDVIFPSWFYSELPFLTAVQLQHSWAWGNNVNLLAAGASYPAVGTTGSGIYAGAEGEIISLMAAGDGERKLLVAQVPKRAENKAGLESRQRFGTKRTTTSRLPLMKDPQLANFNSELIDFKEERNVTRRLCFEELCCRFSVLTVAVSQVPLGSVHYQYRLGVFAGERTYEEEEWSNIKICALYACTNNSVNSCGEVFPEDSSLAASFMFTAIQIEGSFTHAERLLLMPNSLTEQLYPLPASVVKWEVNKTGNYHNVHFGLAADVDNLLTFAIYANYYDKSAASSHVFKTWSLSVLLVTVTVLGLMWLDISYTSLRF